MDEGMCALMVDGFINRCMTGKSYLISKGIHIQKAALYQRFPRGIDHRIKITPGLII